MLAILIIAGSLCYYFVYFLPQHERAKIEIQKQTRKDEREYKCIELSENERLKKEVENKVGQQWLRDFKYKYDKELDSCFIYFTQDYGTCINLSNCQTRETIKSLFDNKIIAEYSYSYRTDESSSPDKLPSLNEFIAKGEQIFGDDFWK